MLSFRFHIVSLVAVFLALAIGIIMGSTVIDRALVDTLEDQQQSLRTDLDELSEENAGLRQELGDVREVGDRLASEGGERLLSGTLADVPVLVVAVRGVDEGVLDDLAGLLDTAGAVSQGTLWLTDRLALADEDAVTDLAAVLGLDEAAGTDELRTAAVEQVADAVRDAVTSSEAGGSEEGTPPDGTGTGPAEELTTTTVAGQGGPSEEDDTTTTLVVDGGAPGEVLRVLLDAGFVEHDASESGPADVSELAVEGTRVILVSAATAEVPDELLAAPLARALLAPGTTDGPAVDLLAAEGSPPIDGSDEEEEEERRGLVALLREDELQDRLSTVDNLDAFAGRVAAVVAVQDLGDGRRGHYGVGPGAQRLVPAPAG